MKLSKFYLSLKNAHFTMHSLKMKLQGTHVWYKVYA